MSGGKDDIEIAAAESGKLALKAQPIKLPVEVGIDETKLGPQPEEDEASELDEIDEDEGEEGESPPGGDD